MRWLRVVLTSFALSCLHEGQRASVSAICTYLKKRRLHQQRRDLQNIVISGDESDEADPSALDKLDELVSGLETGSKRKTLDDDGTDADASAGLTYAKKKKRLARDATENGVENEFGAKASGQLLAFLCDILQGSLKL